MGLLDIGPLDLTLDPHGRGHLGTWTPWSKTPWTLTLGTLIGGTWGHLGAFPILGHYLLFTLLGAGRGVARPHVARPHVALLFALSKIKSQKVTKSQNHSAMVDSRPEPSVRARFGGGAMAAAGGAPSMT